VGVENFLPDHRGLVEPSYRGLTLGNMT